jgi:endonuclease/exonuclease/phosphatase family metal-dependent hydrolase
MKLRVATYNIHKCIGGIDRRFQPERIVAVLGHYQPDIVLLQEVDAEARRSRRLRLVDHLGDALGFRHRTYFPNVRVRGGGEYGNAILSRFPILDTQNIDLTIPPRKRRSVLHARCRVRLPSGKTRTLHVYDMHLGLLGGERKKQLERFLADSPFASIDARAPILVGGDLNDVWGSLGRQYLHPAGFRGLARPIPTFPAYAPLRPLDALFVRGTLHIDHAWRGATAVARYASDHLPLLADLELS